MNGVMCKAEDDSKDAGSSEQAINMCKPVSVKLIRYANIEIDCPGLSKRPENGANDDSFDEISPSPSPPHPTTSIRRYPKRNRAPAVHFAVEQRKTMKAKNKSKPAEPDYLDSCREWSKCEVAFRYDMAKKFFPEPGPSTVNYYEGVDIPGYYEPVKARSKKLSKAQDDGEDEFVAYSSSNSDSDDKSRRRLRKRKLNPRQMRAKRTKHSASKSQSDERGAEEEEGILLKSFYVDSPGISAMDSPCASGSFLPPVAASPDIDVSKIVKSFPITISQTSGDARSQNLKIGSTSGPPSRTEARKVLDRNEMPKVVNLQPFYSDPADVNASDKTEVGTTVLKLGGNALKDCEEFKSRLNLVGLYAWRKLNASNAIFPANGRRSGQQSVERIRSQMASEKRKRIEPLTPPPSRKECRSWNERFKRSVGQAAVNGGNCVTETIVIDDDSDDEESSMTDRLLKRSMDDRSKVSAGDDDSSDDVICLDDVNESNAADHSSRFKLSIFSSSTSSSTSCRRVSLSQELSKIANELSVSTDKKFS